MKLRALIAALYITTALTVAACGGAKPPAEPAKPAPAATQPAAPAPAANSDAAIKTGAAKMREPLVPLKAALEADAADKAQKSADDIETAWSAFEDAVKAKDKAVYAKIEDPLGAIAAGVKVTPLDKKLIGEQIAKLDALLVDLAK